MIVSNKFLFQLRDRILLAVSIHSYGKDIYYPKVFKAIIVHTICICCAIIIFAIQMKQDQTGLDRSARSTLDFGARYQGIKVSRSQGECSDGCDRGDGATSVTELKVNVICEAGEMI